MQGTKNPRGVNGIPQCDGRRRFLRRCGQIGVDLGVLATGNNVWKNDISWPGRPGGSSGRAGLRPEHSHVAGLFDAAPPPQAVDLRLPEQCRFGEIPNIKLEAGDPTVNQAFANVIGQYGDDPLSTFHLRRILAGETGIRITLQNK